MAKTNNTIANALTAQQHYETMCKVAKKAKTWNDSTYKKANDELYALLSECYSVTADIRAQSTAVVRELNTLLRDKGLTFNDGTRLETKVVRVVFGDIGKRAHIYARVLVNAREQNVTATKLAEWLTEQGGVESVRRQHKGLSPSQVKQQRITAAEKALKSVKSKNLTSAPKIDGSDYALAVVQHRKDGKKVIVSFCDNLPLIKQVLAKMSDEAQKEADTKHRSEVEATNRQLMKKLKQQTQTTELAA